MIRYCPTCNRSTNDARFVGEFCEFCVIARVSKDFPVFSRIEYCKRCGRIRTPEGHKAFNKDTLGVVLARDLCNSKCNIKVKRYDEKSADIEVTYPVDDDHVSFEKEIRMKLIHKICQDDYRKSSGYYEAIIQLRGEREKIIEMRQKITKFIESRGAFVGKVEGLDTGIDMYISNKILTKNFFLFYKLKPKASYTLYSIRNGRKVYRNTYLLRL